MDTFLVCFFVGLVVVAWVTGRTVDIEPVDAQECFKVCTVEPGKRPSWVKREVFGHLNLEFYDWSKLNPTQWYRLKGAIEDYYILLKENNWTPKAAPKISAGLSVQKESSDSDTDVIDKQILSLTVGNGKDREACIRVLLLMVYHPEIYNKFNRFKSYNEKVSSLNRRPF